jgi:hypothetical protein
MPAPDLRSLADAVLSRIAARRDVSTAHCPTVPTPSSGTVGHLKEIGRSPPVSAVPPTLTKRGTWDSAEAECPARPAAVPRRRDSGTVRNGDNLSEWPEAVLPDPAMPRRDWNARAARERWAWTAERVDGCTVVRLIRPASHESDKPQ